MGSTTPGFRERWFSAQDGLRLYFRDYGSPSAPGTPMLCLGGLARNSKDFDRLARRLCQHRRVVCPDYRGRGRSSYDPQWQNYRPEVYLNDLAHLLAVCNLHRVLVCGTSMGGLLSMGLALPVMAYSLKRTRLIAPRLSSGFRSRHQPGWRGKSHNSIFKFS